VTIPAFIGDEVSAAAWRLIGVRATAVDKGNVATAFEAALGNPGLLLITAASAAELDHERLDAAVRDARPLILVVPDVADRLLPPDLDSEVDRVLGIEQ
jgi:vacuolar-type H+-ATPase subunit F/Vma7